jgi:arginine deiminase
MAAGAWTLTNSAGKSMLDGTFNVDGDTFKMALFLSTSNLSVTSTTFAGCTNEVGTTNTGYTAGGASVGVTVTTTTTNDVTVAQDAAVVWTAGSANLTAKWAAIYEVGGNVLCFATLDSGGADVTATNGNTLTVGGTAATIFTIAVP